MCWWTFCLLLATILHGSVIAVAQSPVEGPAVLPPPGYHVPAAKTAPSEGASSTNPPLPAPASAPPPDASHSAAEPSTATPVVEAIPAPVAEELPQVESTFPIDPDWFSTPARLIDATPWDMGVELGINGATGSNESLSIRTGGYLKRASEFAKINLSAYYNKTSANGAETQNNAKFDIRNDWLLDKESPWTLFGAGTAFYDEFQAFDVQVNTNGGIGYQLIDTKSLNLTLRGGAGASREIGGPDEAWVPEAIFGFDMDQQLAENQKLYAKLDYFPEIDGFSEFRLVTDVGWEIELQRPSNMSLKLSMTDRYDSTPNGSEPRLLNYSVLLLWKR